MAEKRSAAKNEAANPAVEKAFYWDIQGPQAALDHRWIVSFSADASVAAPGELCEGGRLGDPVPNLSILVDNLDEVYRKIVRAGISVEYGPATEPWGVRRFYVRDPFGRLVNILSHP